MKKDGRNAFIRLLPILQYAQVKIKLTNYVQYASQSYSLPTKSRNSICTEDGPNLNSLPPGHPLKVLSNKFKESLSTC